MVKNPNTAKVQRRANTEYWYDLNCKYERAKDSKSVKQVSNRLGRRKAKQNLQKEVDND